MQINSSTTQFWFRRDLRLEDNAGLYHALKENTKVLPLFIFDQCILGKLEDQDDARVTFIHETINHLRESLQKAGSSILVLHGDPKEIFKSLSPGAVYTNHDYEPYGCARDKEVMEILEGKGIPFKTFKDQVIFEKSEVCKPDGSPYSIFTPYSRKWREKLTDADTKSHPTSKFLKNLQSTAPLPLPALEDIGFVKSNISFPERSIKMKVIANYSKQRDIPGIAGTSRLGIHLRFGTVSIRVLAQLALKKSETWLNELIWRDFYHMILWHHPHIVEKAFKPAYDKIEWKNNLSDFEKWCNGQTGYPIVDAGMRELNTTGFMHNRVRMVVASFLTKHLLIDWRWGEAYFAKNLLDFDLASNNGGWQWAAGTGCDAAPYFRVFNPESQTQKFDPKLTYVKKWVPELGTKQYPAPMIDHAFARKRVLAVYQAALK